jgi:lysophospholipase L1-like esterase
MSSVQRILARCVLLFVAMVVSALMLELVVTLLLGEQVRFPRHVVGAPWGLRINEPNAHYRHKSPDVEIWFKINGQGLRADRDYPYEKPPGVKRIVSLGDSFTMGYEVESDETFSSVLESELRQRGIEVEVLNAGVSGYSNAEAYLYLERELWKYHPDLVLLSFYGNDYADNARTGLFEVAGGKLVPKRESYVPAGRLGNFLNANPFFNWLAGYSNAFAFVKERVTILVKRRMAARKKEKKQSAIWPETGELQHVSAPGAPSRPTANAHETALAVAILDALYESTRARGVPLVLQSIPVFRYIDPPLFETFPPAFDREREGLYFIAMKPLLEPHLDDDLLYYRQSHRHWTPFSHRISGKAAARLIDEVGLLRD